MPFCAHKGADADVDVFDYSYLGGEGTVLLPGPGGREKVGD